MQQTTHTIMPNLIEKHHQRLLDEFHFTHEQAAESVGRPCLAVEIDPLYVDVAVRRWQSFTGNQATLEVDGRTFEAVAAERLQPASANDAALSNSAHHPSLGMTKGG